MQIRQLSQVSFFTMMITVFVILMAGAHLRISDFKNYHYLLAQNSVTNVSEAISQFITNRKRLINIFAKENITLIQKVLNDPENETLKEEIELKIKNYFPNSFSFTLSDLDGNPYYDDFVGYVGDLCIEDIKIYSKNHENLPRIHPNSFKYHYDLMTKFPLGEEDYIIFISFTADEIGEYLKSAQALGHKTMLVYKENEHLIEITSEGARNTHYRENYRLTEDELSYLLFEGAVKGTMWTVYDFYEESLFLSYKTTTYIAVLVVFLFIVIISIFFFILIKREELKTKKAEAIKSEFIAVVSHELRTPLTSINGAIKLVANEALGPINEKIKEYLNMASNNIDRLTGIVNDILDVKKMESGEFNLVIEHLNIVDVVEKSLLENEEYAKKFNANFDFIKPDKRYIIDGDEGRLLQVMANLLSNAVKYGAKNDCINVSFKEMKKHIRINITDHGTGVSEKDKEKLFEKFTQAHSRDKEVVKGTGLGLNIIKSIIEKHGGMVSCESNNKNETTFFIILPLAK